MRRISVLVIALALISASCDGLPFVGGGGEERTVLVDYSHDEFATSFLKNFPKKLEVTPGMTVVFQQTWTGEAHTVTGGTNVDQALKNPLLRFVTAFENLAAAGVPLPDPEGDVPQGTTVGDVLDIVEKSDKSADRTDFLESYDDLADDNEFPERDEADEMSFVEFVEGVDPKVEEAFGAIANAFDEETGDIAQNYGQPCYLSKGSPPKDSQKACPKREQPAFDGTQSFYSSGIIPYEGAQGNTFSVPLADDIKPGSYTFYCAIHGPIQSTEVVVRPEGTDIPSQDGVSRQAREEIEEGAVPLEKVHKAAVDDGQIDLEGSNGPEKVKGPFAGLYSTDYDFGLINEFVPKNLTVKRNQPLRLKMLGAAHTVSFGVPTYFPIVQFLDNGKIRYNPKLEGAAGGAKKPPEETEGPPEPVVVHDAGTYDGSGFWSTGLIGGGSLVDLTLRISKAGTYDFACLIHPPMVGSVVVT